MPTLADKALLIVLLLAGTAQAQDCRHWEPDKLPYTTPYRMVTKPGARLSPEPGRHIEETEPVPPGTPIRVLQDCEGWHWVELPDHRRGWMFKWVLAQPPEDA